MADRLKQSFNAQVELVKSSGGVFEIEKDGELIFSKKRLGRFPDDGEIESMIQP